jgi:DUF1707 SHOCT-like domain
MAPRSSSSWPRRLRLTDADREKLFERLNRQAAAGALSLSELERRVALVSEAETREQAAAVMADLPPLPGDPGPGRPAASRPRWGHGHGEAETPAADWRPTAERFRDPRSNRVMRVWEDAGGARHYVPDESQR